MKSEPAPWACICEVFSVGWACSGASDSEASDLNLFHRFFCFLRHCGFLFAVLSLTIIWFFLYIYYFMPFNCFVLCERARSLAFLVWQRKLTLSFMPYCYVEDMSIVALLCVSVRAWALSSPDALFSLKQYSVLWAFWSVIMLLPLFFRCDSDRLTIPVRKALLIPAEVGVCKFKGENRGGSLQTIMVHFPHLPADVWEWLLLFYFF